MSVEEQRAHPRIELTAEIRLTSGDEALTFSAVNISLGGAFIAADPQAFPELKPGVHVQLRICVADVVGADISCRAQVTRIEPGLLPGRAAGFALRFFRIDMANTMRLGKLVKAHGGG